MLLLTPQLGTGPYNQSCHSESDNSSLSAGVPSLLLRILPGMVARGHGIDALCLYLHLARTTLLEALVELDLPTPHDRPLRRPGGRNPWSFADTTLFIVLWMAGWHTESLGERFGRSAGSARYKARHLGLPRRDRKLVLRPSRPGQDLPGNTMQGPRPESAAARPGSEQQGFAVRTAPVHSDDPDANPMAAWEKQRAAQGGMHSCSHSTIISPFDNPHSNAGAALKSPTLSGVDLFGPVPAVAPSPPKPKRKQVVWTRERDQELAQRWWARQHYKAIARDMGISPSAVQSRRFRLELPSYNDQPEIAFLRPDDLVQEFDPSVVATHIAVAGYVERTCNKFIQDGKVFLFWASRNGCRGSKEFEKLEDKRCKRLASPPRRDRKPRSVPLSFASDPWDDADSSPVPHPASLPTPFAPHRVMMRA